MKTSRTLLCGAIFVFATASVGANDAEVKADFLEVLKLQYCEAMGLYVHEDQLNWEKLNALFYLTTGLFAALGFSLSGRVRGIGYPILICLLGIVTSVGFSVSTWYGVEYLDARKKAVVAIEEKLDQQLRLLGNRLGREFGAEFVVRAKEKKEAKGNFLANSPTRQVIRCAPIVVSVVWLGGLGFILTRRERFGLARQEGDREEPGAETIMNQLVVQAKPEMNGSQARALTQTMAPANKAKHPTRVAVARCGRRSIAREQQGGKRPASSSVRPLRLCR